MSASLRDDLEKAYRATTYWASLADVRVAIRIDALHPELDRWLLEQGVTCWAWISAANPRSRLLEECENLERHKSLADYLVRRMYPVVEGESIADAGDWPPERACLIGGIEFDEARKCARDFGQIAVLVGRRGEAARLDWVDGSPGACWTSVSLTGH